MLEYFSDNLLSLNLDKSGFIIIDPTGMEKKSDIFLNNGILEYKSIITYLGAKISDTGKISNDVELYVAEKRSNITIKFENFCRTNFLAPLKLNLKS